MKFSFPAYAFFLLFLTSPALGEVFVQRALLQLGAAYHYTYSLPDRVAGASYEKKFLNGFVGHGRVGTVLSPGVYLGGAFGYWSATRKFTLAGVDTTDILNYQTIGFEFGAFYEANPRVYWMLLGSVHYPLKQEVNSTVGGVMSSYSGTKRYATELRASVGIKIFSRVSLVIEGGFHWANLRYLESGGNPYVLSGDQFDLSGAFAGVGLGIHI